MGAQLYEGCFVPNQRGEQLPIVSTDIDFVEDATTHPAPLGPVTLHEYNNSLYASDEQAHMKDAGDHWSMCEQVSWPVGDRAALAVLESFIVGLDGQDSEFIDACIAFAIKRIPRAGPLPQAM